MGDNDRAATYRFVEGQRTLTIEVARLCLFVYDSQVLMRFGVKVCDLLFQRFSKASKSTVPKLNSHRFMLWKCRKSLCPLPSGMSGWAITTVVTRPVLLPLGKGKWGIFHFSAKDLKTILGKRYLLMFS